MNKNSLLKGQEGDNQKETWEDEMSDKDLMHNEEIIMLCERIEGIEAKHNKELDRV